MMLTASPLVRRRTSAGPGAEQPPAVAVWSLDLGDPAWDLASAGALLDDAERARAERSAPAVHRRRVLLRAGLRVVLGRLLDRPPRGLEIEVHDGRPRYPARPDVQISCSASGAVGLVALVDGAPVGVDVQWHSDTEAEQALDEDWLTDDELAALSRLPAADRWPAVTRAWTQKEAVLKGEGVGLRRAPATVSTPVAATGRSGRWALAPVDVAPGHLASVAVRTAAVVPPVSTILLPAGMLS